MAAKAPRDELHRLMAATVADEQQHATWTYRAVRPMPVPAHWAAGQHVAGDCSKGVQYLCKWAGVTDPMGMDYGPYGNSATLAYHLKHLDGADELLLGDIVTFGLNGSDHAGMVFTPGHDPLLWSFGHQGAPNFYRLSYDHRQRQYLRTPFPIEPKAREAQLRAETGYWAWVQWRLGEGAWRGYEPAEATVRPNVPARIPLAWWRSYAAFLRNRKKGNPATTTATVPKPSG